MRSWFSRFVSAIPSSTTSHLRFPSFLTSGLGSSLGCALRGDSTFNPKGLELPIALPLAGYGCLHCLFQLPQAGKHQTTGRDAAPYSNLNFSWCSRLTSRAETPFMPDGALSYAHGEQVVVTASSQWNSCCYPLARGFFIPPSRNQGLFPSRA